MRILFVSESDYRVNETIDEPLRKLGVDLRHLALHPGGARSAPSKASRYFPDRQISGRIETALTEFKPDVVHIGRGRTGAINTLRALKKWPDLPVVHDRGAIGGLNILSPLDWKVFFNRRVARICVPSKAQVNNWMGSLIHRKLIGADRCFVHAHPIALPTAIDADERAKLRAKFGLHDTDMVVGTVCHIRDTKNLSFVADIVRRLGRPLVFAIVGAGSSRETAKIQRAGGDSVRFLGAIPEARTIMPIFDIFVTPTRLPGESFGLAPAEAMACGVPVVTNNFGGTAEIIEHGVSGFAVAQSPDEWSAALSDLASDDALRAGMGAAARERIASRYSSETIASHCFLLYRSLVMDNRRNP